MKLKSINKFTLLLAIISLTSCSDSSLNEKVENVSVQDTVITDLQETAEEVNKNPNDPLLFVAMIAAKIGDDDFKGWIDFSADEIFFSPYAHVDTNILLFLNSNNLSEIFSSENTYIWGVQDGTGDSLKLTFEEYEERYINDFELTETNSVEYSIVEEPKTHGNELHNIHTLYPEAILVEIHKSADDDMGMNWRSLIVVIQKQNDELKLIGFVHNEWTI